MHNDNLKRKWIIKSCCDKDIRHRYSWPVTDYKTLVKPEWKDVKTWAISNIKVAYVTMSKREALTEFGGFVYFKIDLLLDIWYVCTVPMATPWF
jgi:hypothetical protein